MGSEISRSIRAWRGRNIRRVVLVGLDNSGKTTILRQLEGRNGEGLASVPTTEASFQELQYKGLSLLITDVGGQEYLRPYWRHHFTGAQGIIYVVDSMDRERFGDAMNELRVLLVDDQLSGVPLVLFVNKQDGPNAATLEEVGRVVMPQPSKTGEGDGNNNQASDNANDNKKKKEKPVSVERPTIVMGGSALNGDGIYEALDWLSARMKRV